jgi:hypothetical protein
MASPLFDASEHSDMSEVEQRRFEIRMNRQAEVQNMHNSFGHHSSATNYRSRRFLAPFQGITFEYYRSLSIGTSHHHGGFI